MKKLIEQRHGGVSVPLVHSMLVKGMGLRMAATAKRHEIVGCVVPPLSFEAHAPAVDVMDMQLLARAALPAKRTVALDDRSTVAAEVEVVLGSPSVAKTVWTLGVRRTDLKNLPVALAGWAAMLGAGSVFELIAALGTGEKRSPGHRASGLTKLSLMLRIARCPIGRPAWVTDFLNRGRWLVAGATNDAGFRLIGHGSLRRLCILMRGGCESYG